MGKLKDIQVKQAKLAAGQKRRKMADGRGLYLLITKTSKCWRLDYTFNDKRKTLALGIYPDVSLSMARERHQKARTSIADGIDPAAQKQAEKQATADSFEAVAREWIEKQRKSWTTGHTESITSRLENNIYPWLGCTPINNIEPPDLLTVLRKIERRGAIEVAHRVMAVCGQVFRYGIATGRCKRDPVPDLRGALETRKAKHMATITEPKKVGKLMRAIDSFEGSFIVQSALQLLPYVFVRPGELRHAEWPEIDLEESVWRIPAEKMKAGKPHTIPLSKQAVTILRELKPLTGGCKYVFHSVRTPSRPMSENTINAALRRLGYDKSEICGHGFRSMASTLLRDELGFSFDVVEAQLAHQIGSDVERAYNKAQHLQDRAAMMQRWADYLDRLRTGADVIDINRRQA